MLGDGWRPVCFYSNALYTDSAFYTESNPLKWTASGHVIDISNGHSLAASRVQGGGWCLSNNLVRVLSFGLRECWTDQLTIIGGPLDNPWDASSDENTTSDEDEIDPDELINEE